MSASKKSPSRGGGGDVEEEDEPLNQSRQSASMRIEDVYDITSAMDGEEGNLTQHPFHTNLGDGSPRPSRSSHASSNNRQSHHSHHSNSANHNKTIEDSTHDPSDIKITWVEHDSQTSCFYQLCEKQSKRFLCCKWTGFRFYNQNHYLIYCSTIWMMIALLTAVILPLVSAFFELFDNF